MTGASPYAAYYRLQDDAIRHAPPYPAARFSGRGIVMAAGGPLHFAGAWVVLNVLRRIHNCQLPVQLWYLGPDELSSAMIELLRPLGVECVDALQVRKRYPARRLGGWECKPYAIIHSPFREVLWIDADNTPLIDPELLFSEPAYQRTGAIFWPDVTSLPPRHPIWEICRVPWRHEPEFESGQIVLDKARCWPALQLTMHLNEWSDFYYQHVLGDKETFHVAWRMLNQPFGMPVQAPRSALGRWPHAPETDGGTLTLFQHGMDGREIFHHRTGIAKWSLLGDHLSFDGFPFEAESLQYLAELHERWDGRVHSPPMPSASAQTVDEIVATGMFRYIRRGIDERRLKLLPDGLIGQGARAAERRWRLELAAGDTPAAAPTPVLVLAGDHGDICRLTLHDDGVWRGSWLLFERMPVELVPMGCAAADASALPSRAEGVQSPPGPTIKPSLLYLSPVIPTVTGNGLAMRAAAVLLRLAERYAVTLVVVPFHPSPGATRPDSVPAAIASRCHRTLVVRDAAEAQATLGDLRYAVLHVFRLTMLPAAAGFQARAAVWHLDLDDIDSETMARLANLADLHGDATEAQRLRDEAVRAAALELRVMHEFQRIYVCSERDRQQLIARRRSDDGADEHGPAEQAPDAANADGRMLTDVVVLANVVPVQGPLPPPAAPTPDRPYTLLFVGTLGYLPNADGIRWFCDAILPLLREVAPCPFRVVIVGGGADGRVWELDSLPDVEVVGAVPDLAPHYRDASAVIVPLRGGGGTRIKVLEAFSYRRPVVSTAIGAEGIAAVPGEHLLIADEPAQFAAACARLMADRAESSRLTAAAHALLLRAYVPDATRSRR